MFEDKDKDDDTIEVEIMEVTCNKPLARSKRKAMEEDSKPAVKLKVKKGGEVFKCLLA